jgi:hypothetical protein
MGLIGFLVFLAGLHLLWKARGEVLFWTDEFLRIFRGEFSRRGGVEAPSAVLPQREERFRRTLRMIAAFGLMMLGPLLFFIDLRF